MNKLYSFSNALKRKLLDFTERNGKPDSYEVIFEVEGEEPSFHIENVNQSELSKEIYNLYKQKKGKPYSSISLSVNYGNGQKKMLIAGYELATNEDLSGIGDENDAREARNYNTYSGGNSAESRLAVMEAERRMSEIFREKERTWEKRETELKDKIRDLETDIKLDKVVVGAEIKNLKDTLTTLEKERNEMTQELYELRGKLSGHEASDKIADGIKKLTPSLLAGLSVLSDGDLGKRAEQALKGLNSGEEEEAANYLTEEGQKIDELLDDGNFTAEMKSLAFAFVTNLSNAKNKNEVAIITQYINSAIVKIGEMRKSRKQETSEVIEAEYTEG